MNTNNISTVAEISGADSPGKKSPKLHKFQCRFLGSISDSESPFNVRERNKQIKALLATGKNVEKYVGSAMGGKCYEWEADYKTVSEAREVARLVFKACYQWELSADDIHIRMWIDDDLVDVGEWLLPAMVNSYHQHYAAKGGKMPLLQFVQEALGERGGIDRIYVEEGLETPWK